MVKRCGYRVSDSNSHNVFEDIEFTLLVELCGHGIDPLSEEHSRALRTGSPNCSAKTNSGSSTLTFSLVLFLQVARSSLRLLPFSSLKKFVALEYFVPLPY